jgi:hypothetical protein
MNRARFKMAAGFEVGEADQAMLESWLRAPSTTPGSGIAGTGDSGECAGRRSAPAGAAVGGFAHTVAVWRRRYRSHGLAGL